MSMSTVHCSYCQKPFLKDTRHVTENIKLGQKFFCSRVCMGGARSRRVSVACDSPICKKIFIKKISELSSHNFCSQSCAATYNNTQRVRKCIVRPNTRRPVVMVPGACQYCHGDAPKGQKYCSIQCWAKNHQTSKETLLANIQELAKKLGRSPGNRECSCRSVCVRVFGSWSNALIQAGLTPNRSLNQRMYKRRKCIAKDGHACNSISELIVDNWMYEHGIAHEKESPYPVGKSIADWKIQNNVLVEYFGLAKDSKRYDLAIEKKRKICNELGVSLIEIYSKDLFPINKLSDIFHVLE